jgi:hypothetical protein
MPIFPHNDSSPDEDRQISFEISQTNLGIIVGVREFWSEAFSEITNIVIPKGDYSISHARVRSFIGGGHYPYTHLALKKLLPVLADAGLWLREGPFYQTQDGDIWVSSQRKSKQDCTFVPYIIVNKDLRDHPKVQKGFDLVFDAMRMESQGAIYWWSKIPCPWPFRDEALSGVEQFIIERRPKEKATKRRLLDLK